MILKSNSQSHIKKKHQCFRPHRRGRYQIFHHSQSHLVKSSGDILHSGCRAWSVSGAPVWIGQKMQVQVAAL